jgi:hypothetical protein
VIAERLLLEWHPPWEVSSDQVGLLLVMFYV